MTARTRGARAVLAWSAGLSVAALLVGCASTAATTSPEAGTPLTAFSELVVAAPLRVVLSVSDEYGVVVTSEGDEADHVRMSVEGDTLSLDVDGDLSSRPTVAVSLPAAALTHLDAGAASLVATDGVLASPQLDVRASGASTARLDTEGVSQLSVAAVDGSTVTVAGTGQAQTLYAVAADASTLHLFDVPAVHVAAEARDASTVEVTATDRLEATASEASRLTYRGEPGIVSQDATEVSSITSG